MALGKSLLVFLGLDLLSGWIFASMDGLNEAFLMVVGQKNFQQNNHVSTCQKITDLDGNIFPGKPGK